MNFQTHQPVLVPSVNTDLTMQSMKVALYPTSKASQHHPQVERNTECC